MHCWNCGNKVEDKSYVCMSCGAKVNNALPGEGKKDSSVTLGIIGLCFALIIPVVTFICSGLGTGKAYQRNNKNAKILNIIALSVAITIHVLTSYVFPDVIAEFYEQYFDIAMN